MWGSRRKQKFIGFSAYVKRPTQHNPNGVASVHSLDREPEDGKNRTGHNGNVTAPEAPTGPRENGEWRMMYDADCAVQRNDEAHDEKCQRNDAKCLSPAKADRDDTRGKLPRCCVETVGNPVSDEGRDTPFSSMTRDRVKIFVCPVEASVDLKKRGKRSDGGSDGTISARALYLGKRDAHGSRRFLQSDACCKVTHQR